MRFDKLVQQILEQQLQILPYEEPNEFGSWTNMVRSMHIERQLEQYGFDDAMVRRFWSIVGKEGYKNPERIQQVFDQMVREKGQQKG